MKTTTGIFILLAAMAFTSNLHAQVLQSNAAANGLTITNNPATNAAPLLPLVEFHDVPITTAIENLARQADINYLIDPKLFPATDAGGHAIPEPTLTFRLQNVSARVVLNRILQVRNLALIEDPVTRVARITRSDEPAPVVDASLLDMNTNDSVFYTNGIIPLIQFADVPLDAALDNLIRQSAVKVALDPRITGAGDPPDSRFIPAPMVNLRWENLTAKQAIIALCQNCDLVLIKDDTTGVIQLKPNDGKKRHHLRRL
jgi:hypothetical protein